MGTCRRLEVSGGVTGHLRSLSGMRESENARYNNMLFTGIIPLSLSYPAPATAAPTLQHACATIRFGVAGGALGVT